MIKEEITLDETLEVYRKILSNSISYAAADRWAWKLMKSFDNKHLKLLPSNKESLVWELITYLYGMDVPSMNDKNKPARSHEDVIEFLKEKGLLNVI